VPAGLPLVSSDEAAGVVCSGAAPGAVWVAKQPGVSRYACHCRSWLGVGTCDRTAAVGSCSCTHDACIEWATYRYRIKAAVSHTIIPCLRPCCASYAGANVLHRAVFLAIAIMARRNPLVAPSCLVRVVARDNLWTTYTACIVNQVAEVGRIEKFRQKCYVFR
jgi:hypothetical protein